MVRILADPAFPRLVTFDFFQPCEEPVAVAVVSHHYTAIIMVFTIMSGGEDGRFCLVRHDSKNVRNTLSAYVVLHLPPYSHGGHTMFVARDDAVVQTNYRTAKNVDVLFVCLVVFHTNLK